VVVVGGGQAGLSAGYHLARRGISFVILDAQARVGDSWRARWDSLRLFTPAQFDGLDGMPFPAPAGTFPTRNQMADYLAAYAQRFALPIRHGVTVDALWREKDGYRLRAGDALFEADHVIVAMANYQKPSSPDFACEMNSETLQMHSSGYRSPAQLREGPVLVAGAGNSGAEIALELAKSRTVWLAGRDVGEIPFRMESFWGRHVQSHIVLRLVFHYLLTAATPMGRKARAAPHGAVPLIRTRSRELARAMVQRTARVTGVKDGRPLLEDGRTLDVANIIWCTGFEPDFSWIQLPVVGGDGGPAHVRGVASGQPGLYFLGLHFLYAMSSTMIHGVGRDASHVADVIARRVEDAGAMPTLSEGNIL
jgi:putative flavoprotein involved in K+ transport